MRNLLIIVLCFFVGCKPRSQGDDIKGSQFKLKGKITEEVQLAPGCGVVAWGTVIVFSADELDGMSYPNESIGIVVTCPQDYDKNFFEEGKKYQVVFSDKNQADFEWVIPNKDLLEKNGLSFNPYAVDIKKLP